MFNMSQSHQPVFTAAAPFYLPTSSARVFQLLHSLTSTVLSWCVCDNSILVGVRWCHVLLICVPQMLVMRHICSCVDTCWECGTSVLGSAHLPASRNFHPSSAVASPTCSALHIPGCVYQPLMGSSAPAHVHQHRNSETTSRTFSSSLATCL